MAGKVKENGPEGASADPAHDSPKRHGDKLAAASGGGVSPPGGAPEAAGDPKHDSPKRQGDKLEHARDAAAGRGEDK